MILYENLDVINEIDDDNDEICFEENYQHLWHLRLYKNIAVNGILAGFIAEADTLDELKIWADINILAEHDIKMTDIPYEDCTYEGYFLKCINASFKIQNL